MRESEHPFWTWARAELWGLLGVLVMAGIAAMLYFSGLRDPGWFATALVVCFVLATLLILWITYKMSGKKRPR